MKLSAVTRYFYFTYFRKTGKVSVERGRYLILIISLKVAVKGRYI